MGINLDTTAVTPVLKNRYTDKKIETLAYQSPVLAMVPKDREQGGALYVGAIRYGTTTARSAVAATAFTTGSPSQYSQWQIPWRSDYASANITGEAIDRAKGDANALVDGLVGEFDGAFISLGQSAGAGLFGNGGGAFGQIDGLSNVATATITLKDVTRIVNFMPNQILQSSQDDGTGGNGVRAGTVTVLKVDGIAGTITATANWSAGIAAIVNTDFLFQQGDYNLKITGFAGWLPPPSNRPGAADSFFTVNRSVWPNKLAGVYYAGNGAPKEESFIQLATLVGREGGRPDVGVLNPLDFADVVKALEARIQITTVEAYDNPQIGFSAVKLATSYGMITLIQDVFCPLGTFYVLQMSTWLLPSMGNLPKVVGQGIDGMEWLRVAGDDAYQMRAVYRANSYCSAPGCNGVGTF